MSARTTKWVRDTNGDRYCAWHLIHATAEDTDDPIASVFPEWNGSARMSGKPSNWKAVTCQFNPDAGTFNVLGTFDNVRLATRAVDAHVAQYAAAHGVKS